MGILDKNGWDVFCSYSRLDNELHHNWIKEFTGRLKRRVQILLQNNGYKFPEELAFFFDTESMPANGPLESELLDKVRASHFLLIFVGKNYLTSSWCGNELAWFSNRFSGVGDAALRNVFIIILTPEALRNTTNPLFQQVRSKGIFQLAFAATENQPALAQLPDAQGIMRENPDYVQLVDRLATTLVSRLMETLSGRASPRRKVRQLASRASPSDGKRLSRDEPIEEDATWRSDQESLDSRAVERHPQVQTVLPSSDAPEDSLINFVKQFPPGPPLANDVLPRSIRQKMHLITGAVAEDAVRETNALRRAVSPELPEMAILIVGAPEIGKVGPNEFWLRVVNEATLKGPQTTVALLLSLPRHLLHGLDEQVSRFLQSLTKP